MLMYDLGVVEFGRVPWMGDKKRLRKIMYGQMAAILSFTLIMYAPGIDLDIELGRIWYSQDALLKRRPQGEKSTVFNPNTTRKRVFSAVTQSYSVYNELYQCSYPTNPTNTGQFSLFFCRIDHTISAVCF